MVVNGGFLIAGQKRSVLQPMFIFPSIAFLKDRQDFTRSVLETLTGSLELPENQFLCLFSHLAYRNYITNLTKLYSFFTCM